MKHDKVKSNKNNMAINDINFMSAPDQVIKKTKCVYTGMKDRSYIKG